jgi:hypothetical protein
VTEADDELPLQLVAGLRLALIRHEIDVALILARSQSPGAAEMVSKLCKRYWNAYTLGWKPQRHARMRLLECLDRAEQVLPALQLALPDTRSAAPPLGDAPLAKFLASNFLRVLDAPQFRTVATKTDVTLVDAVRSWLKLDYPEAAAKLTDQDIGRALEVWRQPPGRPRKDNKQDAKWPFLASLCKRIGLGAVTAGTLETDWGTWCRDKAR